MYTNSRAVCDKLGNCTIVGPFAVKVDDQAPLVSCKAPGGWRRGAVARIACLASDTGAGLTGPAHFGLLAKVGAGHQGSVRTGTRQVCDRIGNCTTVGPYSVSLDDAPPQVSCGPVPGGWQHAPVTIPCAVTDLGSGVAPKNQLILLHLSGVPGRRVIRAFPRVRVCDRVGNCTRTPALPRVRLAIPAG
jgi:hypothetical protein